MPLSTGTTGRVGRARATHETASPNTSRSTLNFTAASCPSGQPEFSIVPRAADNGRSSYPNTAAPSGHQGGRDSGERCLDRADQRTGRLSRQLDGHPCRWSLAGVAEVDVQRVLGHRMYRVVVINGRVAQRKQALGPLAATRDLDLLSGVRAHASSSACQVAAVEIPDLLPAIIRGFRAVRHPVHCKEGVSCTVISMELVLLAGLVERLGQLGRLRRRGHLVVGTE